MSVITRTDVTAVKFYSNYVLAGIGSTISVFEKNSTKLLQKFMGLHGQKIYGFVPSEYCEKLLVFGGKQFTVLSVECPSKAGEDGVVFRREFELVVCDDWLHSAVWFDDNAVALLTAHNVVQKWDISSQSLISRHASKDNSILYSGLLLAVQQDVLVMAGTVFSEVIIHRCGDERPLHHLTGHKGVIFSISCKPDNHIIVTTSDDRSIRIWGPTIPPKEPYNSTMKYWENISFNCKHELYGHLARVMRNCITNDFIISVGEDAAICYWNYDGKLLRKTVSHQNGCIWSVDSDGTHLVTGGGDCGVVIHPLTVATDYSQNEIINIVDSPKKVVFTARKNILVLDANDLIHYDVDNKCKNVHKLNHESTYKMLSLSSCKQLIAVADMNGKFDVFVENCKDTATVVKVIDTKIKIGKILSMQFAGNRNLVFCSDNGAITVLASNNMSTDITANFVLPSCKERWLTASAIDSTGKMFVLGDRCGNIHVYVKGQEDPVKSFNKVHGRFGPTSINIRNKDIVTTGRDGTVKFFSIDNGRVKLLSTRDLEFQWVEKFLDRDHNMICGFQERIFVVYDLKDSSKLLEVQCGGGHRSWDAIRYFDKENDAFEEYIRLVYLKNSDVNVTTIKLCNIVSKYVVNGSHSKEINCLKTHKTAELVFFISGGEDTTLRISSANTLNKYQDEAIFKQLSSIRTLKIYPIDENNLLLISAGGRAQICIKNIAFRKEDTKIKITAEDLIDYLIKGTDKERKGNRTWRNCSVDIDPEMRIMDLDLIKRGDNFMIFAGCSDAYLRVFVFKNDSNKLELVKVWRHHNTCTLNTHCFKIFNKDILVTCTTRGDVTFWDVTDVTISDLTPFFNTKTNKSGINSFVCTATSDNRLFIGTGGDDNAIHLVVLEISDQHNLSSMKIVNSWSSDKYHSSQITGLCLVDKYLISTSIDQRITLFAWEVKEHVLQCQFLSQTFTDIADVQGIDLLDQDSYSITVCVFGKGMEVVTVKKPHM